MKTRVISAIVALSIMVPIFVLGGIVFKITIAILAILGLKEFIDIKSTKKEVPDFIKFISYLLIVFFVFVLDNDKMLLTIDYRVISGLILMLLIPTVLYHDKDRYSVNDAFYMMGGVFFLGISFKLMILFRNIGLDIIIYLFLITIITDSYALFTGSLIGKNKLLESISPKKTWEGMIGGTVAAIIVGTTFYVTVIDASASIFTISLLTLFLSILGQLGDLVFSAIKRYYDKKDFSNIMPGHGGILDRFDSIIFVMLGYLFFISII